MDLVQLPRRPDLEREMGSRLARMQLLNTALGVNAVTGVELGRSACELHVGSAQLKVSIL